MALTAEMQAELDYQAALDEMRIANQTAFEAARAQSQAEADSKRTKLEALRMAKEIVMENYRTSPANSEPVSSESITSMADTFISYVNS